MADPNEIDLKINIPTPPNDKFKELVAQYKVLYAEQKAMVKEASEAAKEIAEGVRIIDERARSTGSAELVKSVRSSFTEGFGKASNLDVNYDRLGRGIDKTNSRVDATVAAVMGGNITPEQGIELVQKYTSDLGKMTDQAGDLNYTLEVTKGDLHSLSQMDDLLGAFNAARMEMVDTRDAAAALRHELTKQADALAEQRENLDANSATYEQEAAELMKRENAYRRLASAAGKAEDDARASLLKTQEAFNSYDGSAEAIQKAEAATKSLTTAQTALNDKIQKVANDRALAEQKQAADAEKTRNKAEEDAKKAEEREEAARVRAEDKARREEEAAARREEREEAQAKRDKERAEQEAYNSAIVQKSKRELVAELQRLAAARKEAGAAGDAEELNRLNRQYSAVRAQIMRVNSAINMQKMAWMQQAATAQRIGTTMQTLGTQFGTLSEAAKNGQLNLVGMASGLQDLWWSMKAGQGPMVAFTMALNIIQETMNYMAKQEKTMQALNAQSREILLLKGDAYRAVEKAASAAADEVEREGALSTLKADFERVNTELDRYLTGLEKASGLISQNSKYLNEELAHRQNLRKIELQQLLTSGKITRDEYNLEMIDLDAAFAIETSERQAKNSEEKAKLKKEAAAEIRRKANDANQKAVDAEGRRAQFDVSQREIDEYFKEDSALATRIAAAQKEYNEAWSMEQDMGVGAGWTGIAATVFDSINDSAKMLGIGDVTRNFKSPKEALEYIRDKKWENYEALLHERGSFQSGFRKKLGLKQGESVFKYMNDKKAAEEQAALLRTQANTLKKQADDAEAAAKNAEEEAKRDAKNAKDTKRRTEEVTAAKKKTHEVNKKAEKDKQKRAEELEKLQKDLHKKTVVDLKKEKKEAEGKASDQTPEGVYQQKRLDAINAELERREKAKKDAKNARSNSAEFAEGSAARSNLDWLINTAAKAVEDGEVTKEEWKKLIAALTKSQQTRSRADDELAKALILQVRRIEDGDKKTMKQVKNVQYELTR